jgi:NAD(P)-dependent dehydrogenase (short-subunit alcohol dehydrogenase family)
VRTVLIFGANGTVGTACREKLVDEDWNVLSVGHTDSLAADLPELDAIIWAQGLNYTGSIQDTSASTWDQIIDANVTFVFKTLQEIMLLNLLRKKSRLVVVSSVWEHVARANKTAYITSKSALGGLVRSLSVDLAPLDISINSILPGVIDSHMTRKHLSAETVKLIQKETPNGRLIEVSQVAEIISFLISEKSAGITGQSVIVDNGWSIFKNVPE